MLLNDRRIPTILLLEEDNDARKILVEHLSRQDYRVLVAISTANAIDWIQNLVKAPDVFLINQVEISLEEYLGIIRDLYSQTILIPDTPTIILADLYADYLAGTVEQVDDNIFIVYLENAQQLFDLLTHLLNNEQ